MDGWLAVFPRYSLGPHRSKYGRFATASSDRLEKQPTDLRRRRHRMRDGTREKLNSLGVRAVILALPSARRWLPEMAEGTDSRCSRNQIVLHLRPRLRRTIVLIVVLIVGPKLFIEPERFGNSMRSLPGCI